MSAAEFIIEHRFPTPNRLMREFYLSRCRRRQRECHATKSAMALAKMNGIVFPELPAICTIVRLGPNIVDSDAIAYCVKSARDSIADVYGISDRDDRGITWRYGQERLYERVTLRCTLPSGLPGTRPALRTFLRVRLEPTIERADGSVEATCTDGVPFSCGCDSSGIPTCRPTSYG